MTIPRALDTNTIMTTAFYHSAHGLRHGSAGATTVAASALTTSKLACTSGISRIVRFAFQPSPSASCAQPFRAVVSGWSSDDSGTSTGSDEPGGSSADMDVAEASGSDDDLEDDIEDLFDGLDLSDSDLSDGDLSESD
eukprot:COSAG02_NODE_12864_length_1480_cov_1.268646_2_plen_138_part_00